MKRINITIIVCGFSLGILMFVMQSAWAQEKIQKVEKMAITNKFVIKELKRQDDKGININHLAIAVGPEADCEAKAKCGSSTISCSIKGDGICSGNDGDGVKCIESFVDGTVSVTGGACP